MKKIFVLGAVDSEMNEIEKILKENNQNYVYAEKDGRRCHPGNSYIADNDLSDYSEIIFIECTTEQTYSNSISLDHHKEGDFGYDKDFKDFLEASSIGQLVAFLINSYSYDVESKNFYLDISYLGYIYMEKNWYYRRSLNEFIPISKKIVLVAASDHSLSEAYQDMCVGVDKNELIEERLIQIAEPFGGDIDLVKKTMKKYLGFFTVHSSEIKDFRDLVLGTGYSIDYLCIRELAISYNQPILVKTRDSKDSPERVMFLALSEKQAKFILKYKSYKGVTINKIFGVPVRGYVGGFL